jgi:acyl-CoA hydrolase
MAALLDEGRVAGRADARGLAVTAKDLQMGIGTIPDSVLHYLTDKKDLGVHTEMFPTDSWNWP